MSLPARLLAIASPKPDIDGLILEAGKTVSFLRRHGKIAQMGGFPDRAAGFIQQADELERAILAAFPIARR